MHIRHIHKSFLHVIQVLVESLFNRPGCNLPGRFLSLKTFRLATKHIQRNLIKANQFSTLKWILELHKPGDCSEPRIWFVPLEELNPSWFTIQLNGEPETDLNQFIWHLPFRSLTNSGGWMEDSQNLSKIEFDPYKKENVIPVRNKLVSHGATECQFCKELES